MQPFVVEFVHIWCASEVFERRISLTVIESSPLPFSLTMKVPFLMNRITWGFTFDLMNFILILLWISMEAKCELEHI